jgi:hypothetical protein
MTTTTSLAASFSIAATVFAFGISGAAAAMNSHAAWCGQQYRSYNPATDAFIGNDGKAHPCIMRPEVPATRSFGLAPRAPLLGSPATRGGTGRYNVFPGQNDPNYGNPFGR